MLTSNLFLLSLAVLILVVIAVLGAVVYFAAQKPNQRPAADRKIVRLRADSLRNAFRQAVELIEGNISSRSERYNIPWVLVLNEGEEAQPLPVAQSGVASVLSSEATSPASIQGFSWQFFDRGIVIDIKAAYLGSPDEQGDEKPWDEFLSLCRTYRPQRPFDSIVVTVPAATLLVDNADARLELERHAKLAHRRLWLAQNRFAMRFAVYVVITGCDAFPGFAAFARSLPESLRASMLGWSSPYDLSTTYQADWVDTAMSSIERAVSDASAELFTLDTGYLDAREFLLLPARIDALRAQLQLYVDELMRPSAYHEPFFFRGIYLTGDSSELAQRGSAQAGALEPMPRDAGRPDDPYGRGKEPSFGGGEALGDTALAYDPEGAGMRQPINALMLQPAFLRDLFEKKIFLEYGLTRPSRSQHLSRPALSRALRWGGVALIGGWAVGLIGATVQLSHRNPGLVSALNELRGDAQERAAAARGDEDLPLDWYRRKALTLIGMNDRLRTDTVWKVFMPGSWNVVDDLNERVHERFEREFGAIAVTALDREMLARVSELAGVARDPSTGQLIVGDDCTAPAGSDTQGVATLSIEALPAMQALQRYVGAVDQFDGALQAMQSLQRPSSSSAGALRLAVRYAFGTELQGNVAGALPYLYRDASHQGDAYAANEAGGVNLSTVQQALSCAFDKGAQRLDEQMFAANPLLAAERSVTEHTNDVLVGDGKAGDFAQLTGNYRAIVSGIDTEQDLLTAGKGRWMQQTQFSPGAAYDRAFARAAQNRLLGPDLVARVRERSVNGFQAFHGEVALRFGAPTSGVVWVDKDARYVVSPARLALRDGLAKLLSQSFMVAPRGLTLPSVPEGSVVTWNHEQLDQAIALGEVRKRFLAEGLATFPDALQPAIEQALDAQFARLIVDQTASAASVAPAEGEPDSGAFDAARPRLATIRTILAETGATPALDDLDALVSRDAMEHLRLVDAALTRSELYSVRPASMSSDSSLTPVLAAFGMPDPASLGAYLDQQAVRAVTLSKEAAIYLSALDAQDALSPVAQRWQAINADLERYQLKNPNSSLLMLEQFLQAVATDPGTGDCISRFPARPQSTGGDYFASLHRRLYDALLSRCGGSFVQTLRNRWDDFAGTFNENVAGRAPFAGLQRPAGLAGAGTADAAQVDFGELGQTLKSYQGFSELFQQTRSGPGRRVVNEPAVRRFVDSFDQVAALLAPLYPGVDGAATGYDVNIDFRANRAAEIAANQVIDWTIRIGDQSLSFNDAPHPLHWEYGMTVTLALRLAKDSPLDAASDPKQRAFSTDGRMLTWQFTDPWALLSFIGQQRTADSGVRANATTQLLKFEFPLAAAHAGDAALQAYPARGRVFLHLTMSPSGKKTPLRWPASFPTHASDWSAL